MNGSAWRIGLAACLGVLLLTAGGRAVSQPAGPKPTTPIKHLVVIFQENHSFDGYFATYPVAANPPDQPHVPRAAGHAVGQRAHADAHRAESQLVPALPDRPDAVLHLRPGP